MYKAIILLTISVLVSCTGMRGAKEIPSLDKSSTIETEASSTDFAYLLGEGDELSINVLKEESLKTDAKVDLTGHIYFPLIGKVKASGATVTGLQDEITIQLKKYYVNPKVFVNLVSAKNSRIHVLGEVKLPGTFTLDQKLIPLEAVLKAGGFTVDANMKNALLLRTENNVSRLYAVTMDLNTISQANLPRDKSYLRNGDIIYVPPTVIADLDKFMQRLDNILRPFTTLEKGIILGDQVKDILRGEQDQSRQTVVSP